MRKPTPFGLERQRLIKECIDQGMRSCTEIGNKIHELPGFKDRSLASTIITASCYMRDHNIDPVRKIVKNPTTQSRLQFIRTALTADKNLSTEALTDLVLQQQPCAHLSRSAIRSDISDIRKQLGIRVSSHSKSATTQSRLQFIETMLSTNRDLSVGALVDSVLQQLHYSHLSRGSVRNDIADVRRQLGFPVYSHPKNPTTQSRLQFIRTALTADKNLSTEALVDLVLQQPPYARLSRSAVRHDVGDIRRQLGIPARSYPEMRERVETKPPKVVVSTTGRTIVHGRFDQLIDSVPMQIPISAMAGVLRLQKVLRDAWQELEAEAMRVPVIEQELAKLKSHVCPTADAVLLERARILETRLFTQSKRIEELQKLNGHRLLSASHLVIQGS